MALLAVIAPLSDLPRVLSHPPWIRGKSSRFVDPIHVATKKGKSIPSAKLAKLIASAKEGKLDETIASPAIAVAMLDATNVFGGWRCDVDAHAWQYFEAHVEATLVGVIPIAVGEGGPRRKLAERLLRQLARDRGDAVRAAARGYGKRVVDSVAEILAIDTRLDCPNTAPEMPAAFKPATFTRPRLHDGRELPLASVELIGHMLAFSTLDRRYEGLEDVKAVCEPRSLAELAWDMARAWEAAGGDKRDRWMIESIAHLGDDEVIRRTTPALTSPTIVQVLGHVATNAAATELCTIAWRATHENKARPAHTLAHVAAAFATVARKRGITVDEVEDSLVPTIALGAPNDADAPVSSRLVSLRAKSMDARVKLEYGSRAIVVGFDERLDPFVESVRGSKLRGLPHAGVSDDPKQVARAEEVWRELQEDVAAIADVRLASLERAMVSGRSWSLDAFRRAWIDHPLMRTLSRTIVWRSRGTAFRIAEDGTFADGRDAEIKGVSEVSAAHPAEMSAEEHVLWSGILADYRIIQPIEQLSRRVLRTSGAKGTSLALVPAVPTSQAEMDERLRTKRFEIAWHDREQTASRACARSSGRVRLTIAYEKQRVVRLSLVAERGARVVDLESIHLVDLAEIAHDLDVIPAPSG